MQESAVHLCLFHLCQSVYWRIQSEELQEAYKNADDATIRDAARSMTALAFVPADDIPNIFDLFMDNVPEDFVPVAEYFEVSTIIGFVASYL